MMDIVFDNIIFSLQKAGGVSRVWKELIARAADNEAFNCRFLEYQNAVNNMNRHALHMKEDSFLEVGNRSLLWQKYVSPKVKLKTDFIFHSSYYRFCRNKHARNITTVHDFVYEYTRKGLPLKVHHQQKKQAILASDAIICVSENTRQDLLNFFPKVCDDRVFVVYNGVSDVFRKLELKVTPAFVLPYGNYVIYVGNRVQPHKNFISLIHALKSHPELNLVMVGGGALTDAEMKSYQLSIGKRFFHLSYVTEEQLNILYNYAFALVYPSVYEGFGIPILEAQQAGCPVIAKKGSSITEVAEDSAILTESGDCEEISWGIDRLEQVNFRKDMVSKGSLNTNRFSWDKMANDVFDIYKAVMQ